MTAACGYGGCAQTYFWLVNITTVFRSLLVCLSAVRWKVTLAG